MERGYHVAIVGATGAVGQELLGILEERKFPVSQLSLLASRRSAGRTLGFAGKEYPVQELTERSFTGVNYALFSVSSAISKAFGPAAVRAGAVVIDDSSAFRMDPHVPLVVTEVNPHALSHHQGIIAHPNCSTIPLVMVLKPLHQVAHVKRVVVATYQSVSGAGGSAMDELVRPAL
jgi:aspartate-semialdehyde dehydrogenase